MIREATIDDIPQILPLVIQFSEDVGIGLADRRSAAFTLSNCIGSGIVLVWEIEDKIRGVIAGLASTSPWNNNAWVMEELIFYIHPEHRHSRAASHLLNNYDKIVTSGDYYGSTMKLMYNSPDISSHYEKKGYEKLETSYFRRH